jgi:hypothetical protein
MDHLVKLAEYVGEHYGLLSAYAIIISIAGLFANSLRHLLFMLSIMAGVYIVMFQSFNFKAKLWPFNLGGSLSDLHLPVQLTESQIDKIVAVIFVYIIGFTVYGLRGVVVPRSA